MKNAAVFTRQDKPAFSEARFAPERFEKLDNRMDLTKRGSSRPGENRPVTFPGCLKLIVGVKNLTTDFKSKAFKELVVRFLTILYCI